MHWKDIKVDGIANIERVVDEFMIWQVGIIPGAKVKVKILEQTDGGYKGYTNIMVKDALGDFYCAIGLGDTVEQALEDCIRNLMKQIEEISVEPTYDDFDWLDPRDF